MDFLDQKSSVFLGFVVSESQKHKNQRFLAPENSKRIFKDSENFDDYQSSKNFEVEKF